MKVLFIGGTGNISLSTSNLTLKKGIELYLLNRGNNTNIPEGSVNLKADINDIESVKSVLSGHNFDVVVNWIAFNPHDIKRDYALFNDKVKQYIFISSASCYQKPPTSPIITESTPLENPYWGYSRDKIACEMMLMKLYNSNHFPVTIVRPSHTYEYVIPLAMGAWTEYTAIERMKQNKKIIIHGDGTSVWTLTHSKDFAKGFIGLLGNEQAIGESFHITSDELLTWNNIYQIVADTVGAELNPVYIPSDFIGSICEENRGSLLGDKAHSAIFDNSKIKSFVPDFKAEIPFKEGIKSTIDWFQADPSRMIVSAETNVLHAKIINSYK